LRERKGEFFLSPSEELAEARTWAIVRYQGFRSGGLGVANEIVRGLIGVMTYSAGSLKNPTKGSQRKESGGEIEDPRE